MPQEAATLNSLPEYILGLARLGSRAALIEQHLYRSLRLSYAELIGKACGMQQELERRGVRAGDRVMIWGASGAAWAIAFYGCLLHGAVVVPLDAAFSAELAGRVRGQTEAALLCTDHDGAARGTPVLPLEAIVALPPAAPPAHTPTPPPETLLEIVYT
ncbi:MAG: AMP-binding protein, partial [Terriglobales bacterium]